MIGPLKYVSPDPFSRVMGSGRDSGMPFEFVFERWKDCIWHTLDSEPLLEGGLELTKFGLNSTTERLIHGISILGLLGATVIVWNQQHHLLQGLCSVYTWHLTWNYIYPL